MGCSDVIVMTDHQPLMGIFGDRDISKIYNPHFLQLTEKSLRYFFTVQHCPAKWHKGADVIFCKTVAIVEDLLSIFSTHPFSKDIQVSDSIDAALELATHQEIMSYNDDKTATSPDQIHASGRNYKSYITLINASKQGFPLKHSLTEPEIGDFWAVWLQLSNDKGLELMDGRIVVPKYLRGKVLCCLHSAHKGVDGMKA